MAGANKKPFGAIPVDAGAVAGFAEYRMAIGDRRHRTGLDETLYAGFLGKAERTQSTLARGDDHIVLVLGRARGDG